jgi:hypothetical protein
MNDGKDSSEADGLGVEVELEDVDRVIEFLDEEVVVKKKTCVCLGV